MTNLTPEYLRTHLAAHLVGGLARYGVWLLVFYVLTGHWHPFLPNLLVFYDQFNWERMQQEYSGEVGHVYPWWSVEFDIALTMVGSGLATLITWAAA
jgi:hypothetical protein